LTPPPLPRPPAWIWAFTTQNRAAQFLGRRDGFFHREGGLALRHRRAEAAQNLFGLIFVDIHGVSLNSGRGKRANNSRGPA